MAVVAGPTDRVYTKTGSSGSWVTQTFTSSSNYVQGLCWNPVIGLFVGTKGINVITSPDGKAWTESTTNIPSIIGVDSCLYMPWVKQMLVLSENNATYNPWVSNI